MGYGMRSMRFTAYVAKRASLSISGEASVLAFRFQSMRKMVDRFRGINTNEVIHQTEAKLEVWSALS